MRIGNNLKQPLILEYEIQILTLLLLYLNFQISPLKELSSTLFEYTGDETTREHESTRHLYFV